MGKAWLQKATLCWPRYFTTSHWGQLCYGNTKKIDVQIPAAGYGLCYLFEGCFFCWERVCLVEKLWHVGCRGCQCVQASVLFWGSPDWRSIRWYPLQILLTDPWRTCPQSTIPFKATLANSWYIYASTLGLSENLGEWLSHKSGNLSWFSCTFPLYFHTFSNRKGHSSWLMMSIQLVRYIHQIYIYNQIYIL